MEECLSGLPSPIQQVTVPETFSVSQIVAADDCFLKGLMPLKDAATEQLRPNPSAVLGRVFHSLLEEAVKSFSDGKEPSLETLERLLDSLLDETKRRLESNPYTATYADLTRTLTPLAWERKRRSLVDAAFDVVDKVSHGKGKCHGVPKGRFRFEGLRKNGSWAEVPISVPILRLKGRIDVLERTAEKIKIVDLKSGRVGNASGEINPKIALQLRLYGILIQAIDPKVQVTLVVNDGTEHPVAFDPAIAEETKEWLLSKMSSFVPEAIISAKNYAKVGSDCRWCGIRHRCENYLLEAPGLWARMIDWPLPLDTWGTAENLTPINDGLVDLTLLDVAGRRVKVFRVRETHLKNLVVGQRVWLFDLASSRYALRGNAWKHPLNFHEISDSGLSDNAWSIGVYGSNS